jgi:hypothetical protein
MIDVNERTPELATAMENLIAAVKFVAGEYGPEAAKQCLAVLFAALPDDAVNPSGAEADDHPEV